MNWVDKTGMCYIPTADIEAFNCGSLNKAWKSFGCVFIPQIKMHRFLVWAPNAKRVSVLGDFNSWDADTNILEKLDGGMWVTFIPQISDGCKYKYCIDGADGTRVLKADPFARFSEHGKDTASIVHDFKAYKWKDSRYLAKRAQHDALRSPMSVYEVHLSSWKKYEDGAAVYRSAADMLVDYCKDMGYTHVELMPVTEFPYDGSWGYQVTGYYAPTSRYGTPEDFKYFVDRLHTAGIGVIIDWVPAHFPKDAHGLASFDGTPLFECKERRMAEHPEWGTLIFDYASPQVQSFLVSSACMFLEEYHVDGIRVDAVSSMLYLSYGRRDGEYTPNRLGGNINLDAVDFLRKLNDTVQSTYPGAVTIAEEASAYPLVTGKTADGGLGFTFKWDMGFMHDTLDYMALDPIYRKWHHDKLTFSMLYCFSENFVLAYSHDEVVHLKKAMIEKMNGDYDRKFASLRTLYGFQFAHSGKKHTFMGNDIAQFIEWNWQQPLDWFLLDYPKHRQLQDYVRQLNKLYSKNPALYDVDRSWEGFKWLNVDDRDRSSVAFIRMDENKKNCIVCACNFTPVRYDDFPIALPTAGTLTELLNSDDECYGGTGVKNNEKIKASKEAFLDMEYSAKINLPPMAAVWFKFRPTKTNNGGNSK